MTLQEALDKADEMKANMMKRIRVKVNKLTGVCLLAISSGSGEGRETIRVAQRMVINTCIAMIHHRLVLTTSTIGLHTPFKNQGK